MIPANPRQTAKPTRTAPQATTPPPPPETPPPENQSPEGGSEDEDAVTDKQPQPPSSPPHEIPQSSIDWNKSWSDFQQGGARSVVPAGREPVTKRQVAQSKLNSKVRDVSKSMPSRQQLFADWRFWVAIIFLLSVFTAFANSGSTAPGVNAI